MSSRKLVYKYILWGVLIFLLVFFIVRLITFQMYRHPGTAETQFYEPVFLETSVDYQVYFAVNGRDVEAEIGLGYYDVEGDANGKIVKERGLSVTVVAVTSKFAETQKVTSVLLKKDYPQFFLDEQYHVQQAGGILSGPYKSAYHEKVQIPIRKGEFYGHVTTTATYYVTDDNGEVVPQTKKLTVHIYSNGIRTYFSDFYIVTGVDFWGFPKKGL